MPTTINTAAIPDNPKELAHWVAWRFEPSPDRPKPRKVPKNPRTGGNAMPNVPATWDTIDAALQAVERFGFDGIGYMFHTSDPYCGVDFDNCRDAATGTITPDVQRWLEHLSSYTEVSPSGTGVHVICRGKVPAGIKRGGVEMYCQERFFTMTGVRLEAYPAAIERRDKQLAGLYRVYCPEYFEPKAEVKPAAAPEATTTASAGLPDNEIVSRACSGPFGQAFVGLYFDGDWQRHYRTRSEADYNVAKTLAFWAGPDGQEQVHRIMWRSEKLARDKWSEPRRRGTWLEETIASAIKRCGTFYAARRPAKRAEETEDWRWGLDG